MDLSRYKNAIAAHFQVSRYGIWISGSEPVWHMVFKPGLWRAELWFIEAEVWYVEAEVGYVSDNSQGMLTKDGIRKK